MGGGGEGEEWGLWGFPSFIVGKPYIVGASFFDISPCKTTKQGWPKRVGLCLFDYAWPHSLLKAQNFITEWFQTHNFFLQATKLVNMFIDINS